MSVLLKGLKGTQTIARCASAPPGRAISAISAQHVTFALSICTHRLFLSLTSVKISEQAQHRVLLTPLNCGGIGKVMSGMV